MQVLTQTDIEASLPNERVDSYTLRAVQSTDHLFHRWRGGKQGDTVDDAGTGQREKEREKEGEKEGKWALAEKPPAAVTCRAI